MTMARLEDRVCEVVFHFPDGTPNRKEIYPSQYTAVVRLQKLGFTLNGFGPDDWFDAKEEWQRRPQHWKEYDLRGDWQGHPCVASLIWDDAHMHPAIIAYHWLNGLANRRVAAAN
jgi:hypothetical protein